MRRGKRQIRRGGGRRGGWIRHVFGGNLTNLGVVLAEFPDQGRFFPGRRHAPGVAGIAQVLHGHGVVVVDGVIRASHRLPGAATASRQLEMTPESLLQFGLLPRHLQSVFLAKQLKLLGFHLIELVPPRLNRSPRSSSSLVIDSPLLLLFHTGIPPHVRLHGVVRNFRPRSLEYAHLRKMHEQHQ